ncbi:MAG: type III secretion system chaperone [Kiritimatiellae bacterium]|nr:type III secretion system chaperone [Kiritimatiellia bacterium]
MEFEELLKPLAAACGVDRLEPDETHMVHLGKDGTALTIVGEPETRTVVLFSELGDLPLEGREAFYEVALKANWLFQGGAGATLAINPESGALALNRALPMDALDGESFVEVVRGFLAVLVRWRKLARDWRGAVEDGAVPGESSGEDPFAAWRNEQIIRG